MPIQNGSGQGGGNGSVWWSIEYRDPKTQARRRPRHEKRTADRRIPQREEVILEDGDHFSVATDPATVAGPIAEFVSRHSAATALT